VPVLGDGRRSRASRYDACVETLVRARLASQLLSGEPVTSPEAVAARLLAIQAQDPRGARLAIRARTHGLTAADVDRALTVDRSLVVSWLNRGTLHMVRVEDYAWLHALTRSRLRSWNGTRLRQLGVSPEVADRAVEFVERSLESEGPLTRSRLRDRLSAAGFRLEGQALPHVLMEASIRGLMVRGPMIGREQALVLVRDWLPPDALVPLPREIALAELARRYLAGHAPSADRDLAAWAGIAVGEARAGLRAIASELEEVEPSMLRLRGVPAIPELPRPRLLGQFDPLLHGYVDRAFVLDGHPGVVIQGGMFRPFAMVDGRAVGTWLLEGRTIRLSPFEAIGDETARMLEAEGEAVRRFLGETDARLDRRTAQPSSPAGSPQG
jgi:hypothetical protein